MHLKHLKITNYKSFFETTEFHFEPGFNVLLGANSSGKTSVLEAITFADLGDAPHISVLNSYEPGHIPTSQPSIELAFAATSKEVQRLAAPDEIFFLGLGREHGDFYSQDAGLIQLMLASQPLEIGMQHRPSKTNLARIGFEKWPSKWRPLIGSQTIPGSFIRVAQRIDINNFTVDTSDILAIWKNISSKIYHLHSERPIQSVYGHHQNGELLPNGANLAYCINHLQTNNKDLFERLNALLNRVFPTIHWVGAPPNGNGQFELRVHTNQPHLNRGDLAVPISKVGTGVGNALAMLYVALTAQTQRLILLEEPNSFLHPRALRELIAILAEIGSMHQYFVTTHSSDVLRTIDASTVTLLEHDGQKTTIQQTAGKKLHELKAGLVDLGISLTDLHGCDKVLWVEGETEEAVFPQLLRHYFPAQAQGVAVLPLYATGDFESRKYSPRKVSEIYKKLSEGSFLAPPMVAIALDRERRREDEMQQIEKECAGVVHFLPKTMLEDYFLNLEAIQAVLKEETEQEVSAGNVAAAIERAMQNKELLLNPKNPQSTAVHAGKVLNAVFLEIGNLEYHKTAHGPRIVEWLLTNAPEQLIPLKEWLTSVMNANA